MDRLVSAEKMRKLENDIFALGIDSFTVMEKAASRIADAVKQRFSPGSHILAVCGRGNNGGDGIAAARMLKIEGYDVAIALPFGEPKTPDAIKNLEIAKKTGIKVLADEDFSGYDVIIDALLGTGLSKDVDSDIPDRINKSGAFVVSADIPSGINSDTGTICKNAVKAHLTVAIGLKKYGHSIYPGREYCGEILVGDIGINFDGEEDTVETDSAFVRQILPNTKKDAHKGEKGRLSIIAGSKGFTGAATLCCEGSLKSGCGLVTLFTPQDLNETYEIKMTEAMTLPLDCEKYIDADKLLLHKEMLLRSNAVVVGPGLGRDCQAGKIITFLLENEIPTLIDADGINALSKNINILSQKKGKVILTPHIGEFSRLTGLSTEEILSDRLKAAREFAMKYRVILVLKGAGTIVAHPDGKCYLNQTGNAGMATGGSGDVLAGIAGAFLASGICAEDAAVAAVFLHGLAGDFAAKELGEDSMLPTDIVAHLHNAFLKIKNQER